MMYTTLKVAVVQWDSLLDHMEELIGIEKCICCRMVYYRGLFARRTISTFEFEQVEKAYCSLVYLSLKVKALTSRYCHKHHHGRGRLHIRQLEDAEKKLMFSLHYHPLIKDMHQCYLCYADASHYNVELAACDEKFLIKQTMEYVSQLCMMRHLFE